MCIHSAFEIAKGQGTFPTDTKGWQSEQAQHKRHEHHFRCFRHQLFAPNAKSRECLTSNVICLESNCAKTSENIKTEALFHYASWSSCFAACLNDDWHVGSHVHASKTIAAASALQISSRLVRINIACSSQARSVSY